MNEKVSGNVENQSMIADLATMIGRDLLDNEDLTIEHAMGSNQAYVDGMR